MEQMDEGTGLGAAAYKVFSPCESIWFIPMAGARLNVRAQRPDVGAVIQPFKIARAYKITINQVKTSELPDFANLIRLRILSPVFN